jgi:hypothetical protein
MKPVTPGASGEVTPQHLVRVHSSAHKPDSKEVFAAVQYHGRRRLLRPKPTARYPVLIRFLDSHLDWEAA